MKRKIRKNSRSSSSVPLPMILIGLGVLMVVGLLIWQVVSANTAASQGRTIPVEEIDRVSLAGSKAALDEGSAVFLDVRDPSSFEAGHIPGAVNIPLGLLDSRASELDPNQWIITYCTWPAEESSARAAQILIAKGFKRVNPILGGFAAWENASYPVEK